MGGEGVESAYSREAEEASLEAGKRCTRLGALGAYPAWGLTADGDHRRDDDLGDLDREDERDAVANSLADLVRHEEGAEGTSQVSSKWRPWRRLLEL